MSEKIITIERLAYGGEGVGRCDGKVVFVPWTAPGDQVRIRVVSDHGRFERGEVIEVLTPSRDRTEPLCPYFGQCGGCQWQHLSYESQVRFKGEILKETLIRVGGLFYPPVLPMLVAKNPWHYRSRIQLKKNEQGKVGYFASHSHTLVPITECLIADQKLNDQLPEVQSRSDLESNIELALNNFHVTIQNMNEDSGLFSQVNPEQNQKMIETVLHFVFGRAEKVFKQKKMIVELFAGAGNFTFPLAEHGGSLVAVESNKKSVELGLNKTQEEGISNIEWISGTAEWGLKKIHRRKIAVDTLVMDPPRRGAADIIDLICVMSPRSLIYISCDPVTLARDLKFLLKRHYRLEKVQPIDMFPQTYHIESVAHLVKT